ncbi:DMT family transporter [Thalassospira profundimaris]|uniref:DMT family transporter n=1 Tax=Thalassospira profundimaris TaxID=502049 RepID=UPI000DEE14D0|nr:DMT family transporter [Thalassospira profundimaris]
MPVFILLVVNMLTWALLLVANRLALLQFHADAYAMTCWQLAFGGLALIVLSPGRKIPWGQFYLPLNWLYGFLRVLTGVSWTAALLYISSPQSGIMSQSGMPLAALAAVFFLGRPPHKTEWIGHALLLTSVLLMSWHLPGGFSNPAVWLMLASKITSISSSIVAEKHPYNQVRDSWAHLRFTGVLLLITSAIFLVFPPLIGLVLPFEMPFLSLENFFGWPTLISGFLVGVLFRGPAMVLTLRSIKLAGVETYFLAASSLTFILMGIEFITARFTTVPTPEPDGIFWICAAFMTGGIITITLSRRYAHQKRAASTSSQKLTPAAACAAQK